VCDFDLSRAFALAFLGCVTVCDFCLF